MINKIREKLQEQAKRYQESLERQHSIDYRWIEEEGLQATEEAIDIINQVEAEYNNGWIPCSERLPEESELVIIYAESIARGGSIMVVACLHNGFWFAQTSSDTFGLTGIGQFNVIAWQPLPEPYKESE